MPAKPLPVPALPETMEKLAVAVAPLTDEARRQRLQAEAASFTEGVGGRLQERLEEFAEQEAAAGRNWLTVEWLRGYLTTRTPLPLTSNVGFQLSGFSEDVGLPRVADFIHRAATVHLREVRGESPQEHDARGTEIDMSQWAILRGGIRHPQETVDEIRRPQISAARATIGVTHAGRLFSVPIADDDGQPLSRASITRALQAVLAATDDNRPEGAANDTPGQTPNETFVDLSYLGSERVAPMLAELLTSAHNAQTYRKLTEMIFVVNLVDVDARAQSQEEDGLRRLRELTFEVGHAWAYKPITYEISLTDRWLAIHFEHSTADGATVQTAVARMQELETPRDAGMASVSEPAVPAPPTPEAPVELSWESSAELRDRLAAAVQEYRAASQAYSVLGLSVERPQVDRLPFKVSDDAVQQLLLTYAQLATYGRVRSVYESVDMREYRAGRTECLRPLTEEAVDFAEALVDGTATSEQFQAMLQAHRLWVKACKAGAGLDRHLLGLQHMAAAWGQGSSFLDDEVIMALQTDFLSTTSLGGPEPVTRYTFAPTLPDGFGIGYVKHLDRYEYLINHRQDRADRVEEFAGNIAAGAQALQGFVTDTQHDAQSAD